MVISHLALSQLHSQMFSCCHHTSNETNANSKSKSNRKKYLINLTYRNKSNHTCKHAEFIQDVLNNTIVQEIQCYQWNRCTDHPKYHTFKKERCTDKCIRCSNVFNNSNFLFTNRNTNRNGITDQENRNDQKERNDHDRCIGNQLVKASQRICCLFRLLNISHMLQPLNIVY